ncbi:single-stranded-DNA-specific exonuclease RecJ [Galbibacter sp. PAP.153]|uniref:single-stranded-DNA-specific exonuclease RecJ n=1 Tax=Galbibacter sp. PAP.153 TaxID=3104623 RepID=UPI0030096478
MTRWTVKAMPSKDEISRLSKELGINAIVSTLLLQRGITNYSDAKKFFRPSLNHLHDPFLMKDMRKAVLRIEKAIEEGENILVYGDYDVDGTTAVSLMSSYLKENYFNVATYIPDRYDEGYGVSFQGIDFADDNDFTLIIALDCGIKAVDKVAYAKEKGIDFIICDHHRPGETIPDAVAILDPKQNDCQYPYDELCGCGVGFKLIQALGLRKGQTTEDLVPYLDLVATAIGADIVPITGENRVLAHFGMKVINEMPRPGIKAITKQLKKELTITDVVFVVAPRINAAGRMKHGQHAVQLLVEKDFNTAVQFAEEVENFNADRKNLDQQITQQALLQIQENKEEKNYTSVVFDETWHKGVIGIVASRLTETYYRPTLVFTKSGEKLAASARSVKGFDVYNAIEACEDCLEQFGGHKYAAGLTLKPEQYKLFKAKFEKVVSETIDLQLLTPELIIDAEIDLNDITPKFYRILKQFAPFGPGNMAPVFLTQGLQDNGYGKCVGQDQTHLKLNVSQGNSNTFGAIGFGLGNKIEKTIHKKTFDAVYAIDENEWNGTVSLQLKLKDIK